MRGAAGTEQENWLPVPIVPTRKVGTAYEPQVLIIDKRLHNAVEKRMIDYFQGNGQAVIV